MKMKRTSISLPEDCYLREKEIAKEKDISINKHLSNVMISIVRSLKRKKGKK